MRIARHLPLALLLSFGSACASAALNVDSSHYAYSTTFDSLSASGSSTWTNDRTLAGWSLFDKNLAAIGSYAAGDGSSNAGSFYSYGSVGSSDRALGGLGSGSAYFGSPASGEVAGWIAVAFNNASGGALSGFTLRFDGEQWRNGGNRSGQTMKLEYGFGSRFDRVSQWIAPGARFDWTSPVTGSTAASVDGNTRGRVADLGGTITTAWAADETLWIRWTERNDVGNDHGLAIDNVRLSVTSPVPEPDTYALLLAGLGLLGTIARRRQAPAN